MADDPRLVVADCVVELAVFDRGAVGLVLGVGGAGPPNQGVVLHGGVVQVDPRVFSEAARQILDLLIGLESDI